jgi:hypothetical protein
MWNRAGLILMAAVMAMVTGLGSCSVLSQSQLDRIENLALKSDTLTSAPSLIFRELGKIRLERGLFYAASFFSPEARFNEIQALAESSIEDKKRAEKADVYVGILNSYFRALKSAANEERWKGAGREFRSLGRGVDSLIIGHNELFGTDIPEGVAKTAGKTLGYFAENINKFRQTKYIKEFVSLGDTLVAECTDSLVSILKSKPLNQLIENESEGLKANYKAYIYSVSQRGHQPRIEYDRDYVELVGRMESVKQTRNMAVSALRAVKNAHHRLLMDLQDPNKDNDDVFGDIQTLNKLAKEIYDIGE